MVVAVVIIFLYLLFVIVAIFTWLSYPINNTTKVSQKISVIIAARNEERCLPLLFQSLTLQEYPLELLEIIIVDDSSEDSTPELLKEFRDRSPFSVYLLKTQEVSLTPKKQALNLAVQQAKGDILLFTDADCTMSPRWVAGMVAAFDNDSLGLLFGAIRYEKGDLLENMLSQEQAALLGSAVASLHMKIPSMCNGANMAVRRTVFDAVNGFEANKSSASGDDELLLHKVFMVDPNAIEFLKSKQTIVDTRAVQDLTQLYEQRRRWAGKWEKYLLLRTKVFAFFIFLFHFTWLVFVPMAAMDPDYWIVLISFIVAKVFLEGILIKVVMNFLDKKINLLAFGILQSVFSFYVVFFGLVSRKQQFKWKDRMLR